MDTYLYFLRHATAELVGADGLDVHRELTDKGLRQCAAVAHFCGSRQLQADRLLSSPVRRAWQTAEALAQGLVGCATPQPAEWLALSADALDLQHGLFDLLNATPALKQGGRVFMVSHEPNISEAIGVLLNTPDLNISIKKSSLTCLVVEWPQDPAAGPVIRLDWSMPCALMR